MTRPRPLIVATLPARSVNDARTQLKLAADAGADAAEIRADRMPVTELDGFARLFPSPLPLVATYRSRLEGGDGASEPAERRRVLVGLARHPFRWIDLELARDQPWVPELPPPERLGRIFSVHSAGEAGETWATRLGELEAVDGIGKLVVRARVGEALGTLLAPAARAGSDVVVLTTGPSGPLFRAWSKRLGFPLVYAALPPGAASEPVEPSQIPVDRLRPFLDAEDDAPLFAVCGQPVGHSLSPEIHSAWIRDDGAVGLYLPLEVTSDREFLEMLGPLAAGGFRGLNVTHPFKSVAAEASSELGPAARACGVANCLTFHGEEIVGENTDLYAILRRLSELRDTGTWDGRTLVVVGAGGAARASLAAAHELGVSAHVLARRTEAAAALAAMFGADAASPGRCLAGTVVIHATSVGRANGDRLDVPIGELLGPGVLLLDWVYRPAAPLVRDAAVAAGASYEDGWRLLVYQAAASYEIWWGHPPPEASVSRWATEGPCAG